MATIAEILASPTTAYAELKKSAYTKKVPVEDVLKQLVPKDHAVFDVKKRPYKDVDKPTGQKDAEGNEMTQLVKVDVNRIPAAFQDLILSRAVGFLYGNKIKLSTGPVTGGDKKLFELVERCISDNKLDFKRKARARTLLSECEVATLWYFVENKDAVAGEPKLKLRSLLLCESNGDTLYPHYDENGDMDAFTREYKVKVDGKDVTYVDVYTADAFYYYIIESGALAPRETASEKNGFGKIPIIYGKFDYPVWYKVQALIERFEERFSNTADTNDYNGDPMILLKGNNPTWFDKGERGKVLQTDSDGDARYLTYDGISASVDMELKKLESLIYMLTQTPDISFEKMVSIGGDISGVALKLMFMDAHLAAENRWEVFGEIEQRELNLIKTMIGKMQVSTLSSSVSTLSIEPIMEPYLPKNLKEAAEILAISNGGKPTISQKASIAESGYGYDPDEQMAQLAAEAKAEADLTSASISGAMQ